MKQTARLLKRLFQNDLLVALLFFRILTINFSAMLNDNFPYPLEKFFICTPPNPSEISAFYPPSPSEFPLTFRGGGGVWKFSGVLTIYHLISNVLMESTIYNVNYRIHVCNFMCWREKRQINKDCLQLFCNKTVVCYQCVE